MTKMNGHFSLPEPHRNKVVIFPFLKSYEWNICIVLDSKIHRMLDCKGNPCTTVSMDISHI